MEEFAKKKRYEEDEEQDDEDEEDEKVSRGKASLKKAQQKLRELEAKSKKYWRPKEGRNVIRVLPPWKDSDTFYKEVPTHWLPQGEGNRMIPCRQALSKKCYLCQKIEKLSSMDSAKKQAKAQTMSVKTRILYNIVDKGSVSAGVQEYTSGEGVLRELLSHAVDPEWGDFTDPKEGYDVIINRKGANLATRYEIRLRRNPSPIEDKRWLKQLVDLDKIMPIPSYEEQKAIYFGKDERSDRRGGERKSYRSHENDEE